ncbi:Gfo/Idh/MocA family protein [Ornithinibacillus halotolerans]|uniref:Oxidoreductase n=1 Tax=Ornithinibacillus halotolerans TaxID=1274357 RepID=A0A916S3T2_9BACI|nr:Gfo/Idh/MocA family oxidoreductase [Ornithinibacillus halotolerans]GGA79575.1 oxidoreductase [Ornithinibacillus halotolerans]
MTRVKIAIIGIGAIAEATHLKFLLEHPDAEVTAVIDVQPGRAEEVAKQYGIPSYFNTIEELIANTHVDAVLICTPNVTHIPIAKIAAANGIAVFLEKPIGTSLQEVEEFLEIAKENNVLTMVGMTHRFRTDTEILKNYATKNTFGDIYYVKAKLFRRRGTPKGWFTNKALSGGGALMDIGVHVLDLAWWLMGQPEPMTVTGKVKTALGAYDTKHVSTWESKNKHINKNNVFDVDDFASAWIRFKNGAVLSIETTWAVNGEQDDGIQIDILGTEGGAKLHPLTIYKEEDGIFTEMTPSFQAKDPFPVEMDHFIQSIRNNETPSVTGYDGYGVLAMLQAIYESSEKNREIVMNDEL